MEERPFMAALRALVMKRASARKVTNGSKTAKVGTPGMSKYLIPPIVGKYVQLRNCIRAK